MEDIDYWNDLNAYTDEIVNSEYPKKLVVSGPGTGKTTSFKKILEKQNCSKQSALVLTFINNLKNDLAKELSNISSVFTFHGYCYYLLKNKPLFRENISISFKYFPALVELVKSDWRIINSGKETPKFIKHIRNLEINENVAFYISRSNFYDAVSFDDSVLRVYALSLKNKELLPFYKQIIVDEFQDLNLLETELLKLLSQKSPVLIAGDDDQSLYCYLRFSDPKIIREMHGQAIFHKFKLPYCMRCTKVIIDATTDLVNEAIDRGYFIGRIPKEFKYFPPKKSADSIKYPSIDLVRCSVQKKNPVQNNYFGRYIEKEINQITKEEIDESVRDGFPTVLIIGPKQYYSQVVDYLQSKGFKCQIPNNEPDIQLQRIEGIKLLKENIDLNLGWRIVLEFDKPDCFYEVVKNSIENNGLLKNLISKNYYNNILDEVNNYTEEEIDKKANVSHDLKIMATTFEGAKGLSAQRVFIAGLHNKEIPRNDLKITDLEICKLLVALTRTRKKCSILYSNNFCGVNKEKSHFIDWINSLRFNKINIDKYYWQTIIPVIPKKQY